MIFSLPGVVGTVKAIISESSTDKTQALGMSLIMGAFSLGLVAGPAVSGALADPIGQYNLTVSGTKTLQAYTYRLITNTLSQWNHHGCYASRKAFN